MPKLAAFPKAWLDDLCQTGGLSLGAWIDMARTLDIDGLELYGGMIDLQKPSGWLEWRRRIEAAGLTMPMLCCSPDFTHRDPAFRAVEIDRQKQWIDMTAALGGTYCRVLSGQRRPDLSVAEGVELASTSIVACLPYAADRGITLTLENHYKDNYWTFPEFAQQLDVFCALVDSIDAQRWPNFGVNYDPSNAILAGDDPLELLRRVRHRVVTMHASDRYLATGTIEDLRREESAAGYAARLRHGEIGCGLNDYDAIFGLLREAGFDGWISIEDGVDGFAPLERSVKFLREKIARHWPAAEPEVQPPAKGGSPG
ncbi:MAG: sugar phosphate isomerase/epimerase family protein [Vicinamibacterales bacterium]